MGRVEPGQGPRIFLSEAFLDSPIGTDKKGADRVGRVKGTELANTRARGLVLFLEVSLSRNSQ